MAFGLTCGARALRGLSLEQIAERTRSPLPVPGSSGTTCRAASALPRALCALREAVGLIPRRLPAIVALSPNRAATRQPRPRRRSADGGSGAARLTLCSWQRPIRLREAGSASRRGVRGRYARDGARRDRPLLAGGWFLAVTGAIGVGRVLVLIVHGTTPGVAAGQPAADTRSPGGGGGSAPTEVVGRRRPPSAVAPAWVAGAADGPDAGTRLVAHAR
jgi:hypothetical protein